MFVPDGDDVLVVPHHHQQLLSVAGAQVWQNTRVSQTTGSVLVLQERLGQVLLLRHLLININ